MRSVSKAGEVLWRGVVTGRKAEHHPFGNGLNLLMIKAGPAMGRTERRRSTCMRRAAFGGKVLAPLRNRTNKIRLAVLDRNCIILRLHHLLLGTHFPDPGCRNEQMSTVVHLAWKRASARTHLAASSGTAGGRRFLPRLLPFVGSVGERWNASQRHLSGKVERTPCSAWRARNGPSYFRRNT